MRRCVGSFLYMYIRYTNKSIANKTLGREKAYAADAVQ